jgi:hypothetical protein
MTSHEVRPTLWPLGLRFYVALHCAWFALYAVFGRGFAYAGWPPVYVGEMLLLTAVVALFAARRTCRILRTPLGAVMICFLLWQAACTAPFLDIYGIDALRDGALWGYSVFALTSAALVLRLPRLIETLADRYRRFAGIFLVAGPAALIVSLYLHDWLFVWPGTLVPIVLLRRDDYAVQLAGVFAFSLQGLGANNWWTYAALVESILAMSSRGGTVALFSASVFAFVLRPRPGRLVGLLSVGLTVAALMAAFDLHFYPPGANREVSLEILTDSVRSLVGDSEHSDLKSTKDWRLAWWAKIWNYTVDGPYFWSGKGYGINLADSDGFQVGTREEPLRSPHNSHLTFLARAGVPGFALWLALQLTWAVELTGSYLRARSLGQPFWIGVFAWLLAFWLAFIIEAAFDVSLESPMSGIPFWTVFGIGWGCHIRFQSSVRRAFRTMRVSSASNRPLEDALQGL